MSDATIYPGCAVKLELESGSQRKVLCRHEMPQDTAEDCGPFIIIAPDSERNNSEVN